MTAEYIINDTVSFFQVAGNGAATALDAITVLPCSDLQVGSWCYNLILDATGKIVSDLTILRMAENDCLLLLPSLAADALFALLDRALPADIEVEDHSNALIVIERFGGGEQLPGVGTWSKLTSPGGISAIVFARACGCGYILAESAAEMLADEFAAGGDVAIDLAGRDALRITAGRPAFESEMSPRLSPLEAGLEELIAANADRRYPGCLELQARAPEYRTVRADFDGTRTPRPGSPVKIGGREVGIVTNAAISRQNTVMAFIRIKANCEVACGVGVLVETGKTPITGKIV